MKNWLLPRRTFLKGAGSALLLPSLDVMFQSDAHAENISPRFVAFFMSLGIYGQGYDPTKSGQARYFSALPEDPGALGVWLPRAQGVFQGQLPPVLSPLESLKHKIAIISGLSTFTSDPSDAGKNHSAATTAWLTSAWKSEAEARLKNIKDSTGAKTPENETPPSSIDQFIANSLGILPGTTLNFNPDSYDYSENQQGGHGGYISYNSSLAAQGSSIVPKSTDPKKVFQNLFTGCNASSKTALHADEDKSVLDQVMLDIASMEKKVSTADKARLQAYLQNIRELELKLGETQQSCPSLPQEDPKLSGSSLDWVTHLNLMVDVIALALSSGVMPVATLMTNTEADGAPMAERVDYLSNFVGIHGKKVRYHSASISTHTDIAHVQSSANIQAIEEHIAYSQMLVTFLKRLLLKLDTLPTEPNGRSPLDNSLILAGACHSDSCTHRTRNLPTLLAGGKAFGLDQGKHHAMSNGTNIGDFYYTLARAMGINSTSFNGYNKILNGIFI